jgi:PIN domain nuclease of toxin-antitoxin system
MAGNLPGSHKDPFDRLLAAQSIVENMPIMTVDAKLRELGAEVVW